MSERILRMHDLTKKVGLQKSAIYQKISLVDFPRPIELGERARGWRESEVEAWIKSLRRAA